MLRALATALALSPRRLSSKGGEEGGVKFDRSCFGVVASNANYVTLGSAIQKARPRPTHPVSGAPRVPLAFLAPPAARRRANPLHATVNGRLAEFGGRIRGALRAAGVPARDKPWPPTARAGATARRVVRRADRALSRAQAGLKDALMAPGPLTVFAPNDDAFIEVIKALKTTKLGLMELPNLGDILKNHVVAGAIMAADLKEGQVRRPRAAWRA